MLRYFRDSRQQFLKSKKFSKYLLYAIGEIVLVVIGILIALQLNLYQEGKKNKEVEITYLKGILNDLNQDIDQINELLKEDTIRFNSYTTVQRAFTSSTIEIYSPAFIQAIGLANVNHSFNGNSTVFEDMKSSGKINFINSDELRFHILQYYKKSEEIYKLQNESALPRINELASRAFIRNIDLNSLIEQFLFPDQWKAEVDALDLSFFEQDSDSQEVKEFANSISMMKALVQGNHVTNLDLLYQAETLKQRILDYLK